MNKQEVIEKLQIQESYLEKYKQGYKRSAWKRERLIETYEEIHELLKSVISEGGFNE